MHHDTIHMHHDTIHMHHDTIHMHHDTIHMHHDTGTMAMASTAALSLLYAVNLVSGQEQ